MVFLFVRENIGCGKSLEAPHRGASNDFPQPMFSCTNIKEKKQRYFSVEKKNENAYLELRSSFEVKIYKVPFLRDATNIIFGVPYCSWCMSETYYSVKIIDGSCI